VFTTRYTRRDLTLANAFTVLRIVLIPFFGWLWYRGENERALWVFGIAAFTDLLDGFLARWLNQKSPLGALLDPMADKLLVFVALIVGLLIDEIPLWLAAVIIARDALLAAGAIAFSTRWKAHHGPSEWRPTRIGKYAMFMQTVSIVLVIVDSTLGWSGVGDYARVAMLWTAVLTVIAGTQYILRAAHALREGSRLAG
jgi:cardiolipin synthase (CMP-forming)